MPPPWRAIATVYELREFFEWRGLGSIDHSGVRSRATPTPASTPSAGSPLPNVQIADPQSCQCGEVLKGVAQAVAMQGVRHRAARRRTPLGALMVSSEGACAAYYQYGGVRKQAGAA